MRQAAGFPAAPEAAAAAPSHDWEAAEKNASACPPLPPPQVAVLISAYVHRRVDRAGAGVCGA